MLVFNTRYATGIRGWPEKTPYFVRIINPLVALHGRLQFNKYTASTAALSVVFMWCLRIRCWHLDLRGPTTRTTDVVRHV